MVVTITSLTGLFAPGLKGIFFLINESCIRFKSSVRLAVQLMLACIIDLKETSSASSLELQIRLSGRSLIKNKQY